MRTDTVRGLIGFSKEVGRHRPPINCRGNPLSFRDFHDDPPSFAFCPRLPKARALPFGRTLCTNVNASVRFDPGGCGPVRLRKER